MIETIENLKKLLETSFGVKVVFNIKQLSNEAIEPFVLITELDIKDNNTVNKNLTELNTRIDFYTAEAGLTDALIILEDLKLLFKNFKGYTESSSYSVTVLDYKIRQTTSDDRKGNTTTEYVVYTTLKLSITE